ncbi:MAG TPA: AAA family ATPase [Puia sp.]|nr:AAA family ATPase [Puia sp.]
MQSFKIRNFRAIQSLDLSFHKGVNVLIGENNSGKSAIIDAMRICLSYGSSWRDISFDFSDFHIDRTDCNLPYPETKFHLHFAITKEEEMGWFHELYFTDETGVQDLQIHFRFYVEDINGIKKIRRRIWGGAHEGQVISPDILDLFYYVYLEPLRDAIQHLRPVRGNKIGQLFLNLITEEAKREALSAKVRGALNEDEEWKTVIGDGTGKINDHLLQTSIRGKEQDVNLDFLPFEFKRIVENLRMQMPVFSDEVLNGELAKQKYLDLFQNGLGYNNLIYTATILGHLKQRSEVEPSSYMALFIEEPEAHLHPQLQNIFFKYLSGLNNEQFQIFISSHSPTVTAKSNLDTLIILQHQAGIVSALPLIKSQLLPENRRYLQKFLDVTKSQLFFANGVILVEGISEALLLPIFSRMMGDEFDLDKAGVEIVNVNGIAFDHFAKLFNGEEPLKRLHVRCSVITDDDRQDVQDEESARAQNVLDLQSGSLKVFLSVVTFEYELFITAANKDVLLNIFSAIRPRASANILADENLAVHALAFVDKVRRNKAKSELAHSLAIELDNDPALRQSFVIPQYIQNAIKWVTKGE